MRKNKTWRMINIFLIISVVITLIPVNSAPAHAATTELYVATDGSDSNPGTIDAPFKTLEKAKRVVRTKLTSASGQVTVWVRGGVYYLEDTLAFTPDDSGSSTTPVTYSAYPGEEVVLSGGQKLTPEWENYKDGIMVADVGSNLSFDRLFLNGDRQIMARYPNYDPNVEILNGYASDAINPERVAKWSDPTTGFVRGLHQNRWGGNSFKITGVSDNGNVTLQWAGDNNRGSGLHGTYRMVENIFEELDAPGEWFYDKKEGKLYFYPPEGTDLNQANIEVATLEELINVKGTDSSKVEHITFSDFTFTHTHRTLFTRPYEPLLRSDWRVARAGTIFMQDAENITVKNSTFDQVGGNAIFISGYNRNHLITNNEFSSSGSTDVLIAGLQSAVRHPSTWEEHKTDIPDTTPGPLTEDYPKDITVSFNHMYNMGVFEKQSAGVNISTSRNVKVSHNTVHHGPRAGINIGDGAWGGHIIENNDIFDMVLETSDHGPFNSWGRDRFWSYGGFNTTGSNGEMKKPYAKLDAMETTILRNNRILHHSDWGFDLDDGSTNYEIYNNLLLNTGIKLREGFFRNVHDNILVNGSIHFHVGYAGNDDVIKNNIIVSGQPYKFISDDPVKGNRTHDNNVFWNNGGTVNGVDDSWKSKGFDINSIIANPLFEDPENMNYKVKTESPALSLGFENFPMDQFGKPGAPIPSWPVDGGDPENPSSSMKEPLMGAEISTVDSEATKSALGLPDLNGVYFVDMPNNSYAESQGFQKNDVIREINGSEVTTGSSFWTAYNKITSGAPITAKIWRNQSAMELTFGKISGMETLNNTAGVVYIGNGWDYKNINRGGNGAYYSDVDATTTIGDSFEFTFNGTGIEYISRINRDQGDVDIYIDGAYQKTISGYNDTREEKKILYSKKDLTPGIHTIKGVMKSGQYMIVDAFRIYSSREVTSSADMKTLVERYEEEGAFESDGAARSLKVHLTAVSLYEEKGLAEKVVKHMKGFKQLLVHQKDNKLISDKAYNALKADTDALIQKWQ